MKAETKDKIFHFFAIAAMVTPPWNIFWWIVGAAVYYGSGGRKWDTSGDGALGIVLAAPVTLPAMPFLWWRERQELKEYERKQALYREAAEWMRGRLLERGISVKEAWDGFQCVRVIAEPDESQIPVYGQVCAEAVHKFGKINPEELLGGLTPIHCLDRAWAEKYGFTFFAEEVLTRPCVDCGNTESLGFHFNERAVLVREYSHRRKPVVYCQDGSKREIDGHICRKCLDKMGWRSMSG